MTITKTKKNINDENNNENTTTELLQCGIVMPISAIDGCDAHHWTEVLSILKEAAAAAGFKGELVSHLNESGNIQKEIVRNLYQNEIVVCDISGKNPNVMLELGIRLAFDKPTIVVKDDVTDFSFDISAMKHLIYRRDLRFKNTINFKNELTELIQTTHDASQKDDYSSFIRSFGEFKILKIDEKQVPENEYIIEQLKHITTEISALKSEKNATTNWSTLTPKYKATAAVASRFDQEKKQISFIVKLDRKKIIAFLNYAESVRGIEAVEAIPLSDNQLKIKLTLTVGADTNEIHNSLMLYAGYDCVIPTEN